MPQEVRPPHLQAEQLPQQQIQVKIRRYRRAALSLLLLALLLLLLLFLHILDILPLGLSRGLQILLAFVSCLCFAFSLNVLRVLARYSARLKKELEAEPVDS